jgi:hypothetical protein
VYLKHATTEYWADREFQLATTGYELTDRVGRNAQVYPNESSEFLVQAFNARSGNLLWEDRHSDTAFDLATGGDKAFAVVGDTDLAGKTDFLIRAYEATPEPQQEKARRGPERSTAGGSKQSNGFRNLHWDCGP